LRIVNVEVLGDEPVPGIANADQLAGEHDFSR
jgi:hypothetical protein